MEKTARPEMIDVRKSKDEIVAAVMCTLIMWMMVMIIMMMMEVMLLDNGGEDVKDRGGGRSDVHLVAELVVAAKHDQTAPRDLVCANSYIQFFFTTKLTESE